MSNKILIKEQPTKNYVKILTGNLKPEELAMLENSNLRDVLAKNMEVDKDGI